MNKYRTIIILSILLAAAGVSACVSERSAYDADYGNSVRSMIISQTHDPLALVPPPPSAKGMDGQKGEAVLEAYRGAVSDPAAVKQSSKSTISFAD